ncbi:MAG: nucleotidyltransferase domain-containing protein [Cyanobacteria bacterium J06631_12]
MVPSALSNLEQGRIQFEKRLPDVQLAVLFGSRVKGKATSKSDWDLAVLPSPGAYQGLQIFSLQADIGEILNLSFDDIDLVDLRYCSPLLGFAIACEGKLLYERQPATFHRFQVKAFKRYADTAKFRRLHRVYLGLEDI